MATFPTPDEKGQPGPTAQDSAKRRRLKRISTYTASAIGILVLLGAVVYYGMGMRAYRRYEDKIDQLRAAGQPVDVADLKIDPVPAEQAANTYLSQAEDGLEAVNAAIESLDDADHTQLFDCNRLTPRSTEALTKVLEEHGEVFPLLVRAADCSAFDPELQLNSGLDAYLESSGQNQRLVRWAGRALYGRGLLLLNDGKPDDALRCSLTMLRLARRVDAYDSIDYLMANACRQLGLQIAATALQAGNVDEALQNALDAELDRATPLDSFRVALVRERALGSLWFRDAYGKWKVHGPLYGLVVMNDRYHFLCNFDAPLELAGRPYQEIRDRLEEAENAPFGGIIAALTAGSLLRTETAAYDDVARIRTLWVFSALVRRANEGQTAEPTLADLGLPPEATIDPFTGEPLKLKRLTTGWVVYSVGRNLKDDGGILGRSHDIGVGPAEVIVDDDDSPCGSE